jgi:hypothetical protein
MAQGSGFAQSVLRKGRVHLKAYLNPLLFAVVSGKFDRCAYELQHAQMKVQSSEERLQQQALPSMDPAARS